MKYHIGWGLLILLGLAGLLWIGWRYAFRSDPLKESTLAPDFALPDQNGKPQQLSDYRGKYVALMFYPKSFTPG
jgi:cytochrome oxidase Cu insertion factor (SCO1/SenC/PrrC family)